jgi:GTPase SAR1 family protein
MSDDVVMNIQKVWDQDMGRDIGKLWNDPGIKKTFERRNEFQLDDSTQYYMTELERISQPDYVPSQEDVLRTRVKTTGVVEMKATLGGKNITMLDVGGQRNERKKWMHCFDNVSAVIFVISLAEYDQKCYEDNETPRMQESLELFTETINSKWFVDTPIILFMNKSDLFKEKIKTSKLNVMFSEYSGSQDYESCMKYIQSKFEDRNKFKETKKIHAHPTCATDTKQLQTAFDAIKDILTKPKK